MVRSILILRYTLGFMKKCINLLLYPVILSDCPSPDRGVLCILIDELISKSALLLFTILGASKPQYQKRPVFGNRTQCLETVHRGILVILHPILQ